MGHGTFILGLDMSYLYDVYNIIESKTWRVKLILKFYNTYILYIDDVYKITESKTQ